MGGMLHYSFFCFFLFLVSLRLVSVFCFFVVVVDFHLFQGWIDAIMIKMRTVCKKNSTQLCVTTLRMKQKKEEEETTLTKTWYEEINATIAICCLNQTISQLKTRLFHVVLQLILLDYVQFWQNSSSYMLKWGDGGVN